MYAVKQLFDHQWKGSVKQNGLESLREVQILRKMKHAHIVELLFSFMGRESDDPIDEKAYLAFEPADTDLQRFLLTRPRGLGPFVTRAWAAELAHALAYVHGHQVIHRDVKPANILVHMNSVTGNTNMAFIKLCDFGFSICSMASARFWGLWGG